MKWLDCKIHGKAPALCINWRMQYHKCTRCVDEAVLSGELSSDYDPEFQECARDHKENPRPKLFVPRIPKGRFL